MSGHAARPDRRAARLACLLLALASLLLSSCRSSPAAPPMPPGDEPTQLAAAQTSVDALAAAVLRRDAVGYRQQLSSADPAFAETATRIFNLGELPLTSLSLRVLPATSVLSPQRRELLGEDADVRQVSVLWAVAGDRAPAQHLLWLTFLAQGPAAVLAGAIDGPVGRGARPLWLLERVRGAGRGQVTVLAGPRQPSELWVERGNRAAAAVRKRLAADLHSRWNGRLVVELPSTPAAFERVLGVGAGSYAQIAAVSWPEGPDPATAPARIVVNPALSSVADEDSLAVLLAHEATHVAVRSSASKAPTWLVEGFADYLAYDAHPRTARLAAEGLLASVRRSGVPATLPRDADFTPGAPGLNLVYARSWLACRYLAEEFSHEQLARFYLRVDDGESVDAAARAVFRLTERELTTRWGASLRAAARAGSR